MSCAFGTPSFSLHQHFLILFSSIPNLVSTCVSVMKGGVQYIPLEAYSGGIGNVKCSKTYSSQILIQWHGSKFFGMHLNGWKGYCLESFDKWLHNFFRKLPSSLRTNSHESLDHAQQVGTTLKYRASAFSLHLYRKGQEWNLGGKMVRRWVSPSWAQSSWLR